MFPLGVQCYQRYGACLVDDDDVAVVVVHGHVIDRKFDVCEI